MNFNVLSPETTTELFETITEYQNSNFRFCAGGSDLLLELKLHSESDLTLINLARLNDDQFSTIQRCDDGIRIGAMVTAKGILSDIGFKSNYPVLYQSANQLASRQIRQVATVGGNICTASPAGDIACALVALEAQCEIISIRGSIRTVPLDQFLLGVRKIDLNSDEVLQSVIIPERINKHKVYSDFIKIGTRLSMEIALVSLGYYIEVDEQNRVCHAGIAIGSVAPTIKFSQSACDFLIGKKLNDIDSSIASQFSEKVMEYASPISDIRASDWYRKEVLKNISKNLFNN